MDAYIMWLTNNSELAESLTLAIAEKERTLLEYLPSARNRIMGLINLIEAELTVM